MATMKIKKGDMVKVIAGKDKDKEQYRSGRGYQHGDKTCKTKHG